MSGIAEGLWQSATAVAQLCYIKASVEAKKNCPITATVFKVLGTASIIAAPIVCGAYILSSLKSTYPLALPLRCDDSPNCDNVREYYDNLDSQKNFICYAKDRHPDGTLFSPEEQADEAKRCEALKLWDICYPGIQLIAKKTAETFSFCRESGMLSIEPFKIYDFNGYVTPGKGLCFSYYERPTQLITYNNETCVKPNEVIPTWIVRKGCFSEIDTKHLP